MQHFKTRPFSLTSLATVALVIIAAFVFTSCSDDDSMHQTILSDADFENVDWGHNSVTEEGDDKIFIMRNSYGQVVDASFYDGAGSLRPSSADELASMYFDFDEDKGVRVQGTVYYLHYEKGLLTHANGRFYQIRNFNFQQKVSKEKAKEIFAKYWGVKVSDVVEKEKHSWGSDSNIELYVAMLPKGGKLTPWLVWYFLIDSLPHHIYVEGYVDAQTGDMIYTRELFDEDN